MTALKLFLSFGWLSFLHSFSQCLIPSWKLYKMFVGFWVNHFHLPPSKGQKFNIVRGREGHSGVLLMNENSVAQNERSHSHWIWINQRTGFFGAGASLGHWANCCQGASFGHWVNCMPLGYESSSDLQTGVTEKLSPAQVTLTLLPCCWLSCHCIGTKGRSEQSHLLLSDPVGLHQDFQVNVTAQSIPLPQSHDKMIGSAADQ